MITSSGHMRLPAQQVATLFVSASVAEHAALNRIFSRSNWKLHSAYTSHEALAILGRDIIPVVICQQDLPDGNWKLLLERTKALPAAPRFIVSTRDVNEHLWGDVLQRGGYDLLAMPWDSREVLKVIALAWRSWEFASRSLRHPPLPALSAKTMSFIAAVA